MPLVDAEPYEFTLSPGEAALLIIDLFARKSILASDGFDDCFGADFAVCSSQRE